MLFKGFQVDQGFKYGAGLAPGQYMIVLIVFMVDPTHPCSDLSAFYIHSQKTSLQKAEEMLERIQGIVFPFLHALPGEYLHFSGKLRGHILSLLSRVVDHQLLFGQSPPQIKAFPLLLKNLLQVGHMTLHRLFCIVLQPAINGGIYLQTISV